MNVSQKTKLHTRRQGLSVGVILSFQIWMINRTCWCWFFKTWLIKSRSRNNSFRVFNNIYRVSKKGWLAFQSILRYSFFRTLIWFISQATRHIKSETDSWDSLHIYERRKYHVLQSVKLFLLFVSSFDSILIYHFSQLSFIQLCYSSLCKIGSFLSNKSTLEKLIFHQYRNILN